MSDKSSDKRVDEAASGSAKAVGMASSAVKAAIEQGAQVSSRAVETAAAATRASAAAVVPTAAPAAVPAAAPATAAAPAVNSVPTIAGEVARATQTGAEQAADTLKSSMEKAMTTAEEFMSFGQGNIEAFVKSSQIWTSGLQDLGRHVAQSAQAQFDGTVSAMKALASVKSVHEAFELQSSSARSALEKAVQDSGKLTDASMKLAEQAIAPITARVNYVAERFGGRTAA